MRRSTGTAIICGALALVATSAVGQNTVRPKDLPASNKSLPGDFLPPFLMLDANNKLPPIPAGFGPPPGEAKVVAGQKPTPETKAVGPSLDLAIEAGRAAIKACYAKGALIGVAIVDSAGEVRATLSADGSDGSHVFVAQRKAIVAVAFAAPSGQANGMIAKDAKLMSKVTPAMFVTAGAVPIVRKGQLIGAIGSSGAHGGAGPIGSQDEECAVAGLKAISGKLK